ncbi:hypothetical protein Daus18300_013649 [Diaporthe australafricana]|uniref:Uncharacterized protein n=1 Tax=Diaporthe australafricana TaxID=127596 RepID=A0ABR3VY78_9PEZI
MSSKNALRLVGSVTLESITSKNGAKGAKWAENVTVKAASEAAKRIKYNSGALAHQSHSDPAETQQIISAQFGIVGSDNKFKRVESGHIREDGTIKWSQLSHGQTARPTWLNRASIIKNPSTGQETIKDSQNTIYTVHADPKDAKRKYVTVGKQTYYF